MRQIATAATLTDLARPSIRSSYVARLALLAVIGTSCKELPTNPAPEVTPVRATIHFAARDWQIKVADMMGPGNNRWSASNVSVDSAGLHLRITRQASQWSCAEVSLPQALGQGCYTFVIGARPDSDIHTIAGLFLYQDDDHELDIELGQFGISSHPGSQYVIQPINDTTVATHRHQFSLRDNIQHPIAHTIALTTNSVSFSSNASSVPATPLQAWTYQSASPISPDGTVHINYWLFSGTPPTDNRNHELVIKDFIFSPTCNTQKQ